MPQIIESFDSLSGGQRFNAAFTQALSKTPNLLLLDEPTNHLDLHNRKSLIRMLKSFSSTLMIVTHDVELIRECVDTLWYTDHGHLHVFSGQYDDLMQQIHRQRASVEAEIAALNQQKNKCIN